MRANNNAKKSNRRNQTLFGDGHFQVTQVTLAFGIWQNKCNTNILNRGAHHDQSGNWYYKTIKSSRSCYQCKCNLFFNIILTRKQNHFECQWNKLILHWTKKSPAIWMASSRVNFLVPSLSVFPIVLSVTRCYVVESFQYQIFSYSTKKNTLTNLRKPFGLYSN